MRSALQVTVDNGVYPSQIPQDPLFLRFRAQRERQLLQASGLFNETETETFNEYIEAYKQISYCNVFLDNFALFLLSQVLRRPVIVYGADVANAAEAEHQHGVYLPLLCDARECYKNPIVLLFTGVTAGFGNGHFSALVSVDGELPSPPRIPLEYCADGVYKALVVRYLTKTEDDELSRNKLLRQYLGVQVDTDKRVYATLYPSNNPSKQALWSSYLANLKRQISSEELDNLALSSTEIRAGVSSAPSPVMLGSHAVQDSNQLLTPSLGDAAPSIGFTQGHVDLSDEDEADLQAAITMSLTQLEKEEMGFLLPARMDSTEMRQELWAHAGVRKDSRD